MASGNREGPQLADYLPAEYRSGPFLSEAQSAVVPALPAPPPVQRGLGLRTRLMLWLALWGFCPLLLLGGLFFLVSQRALEGQSRSLVLLLRDLLIQAPAGTCTSLITEHGQQLLDIERKTGHEVALYAGGRVLISTLGSAPPLNWDVAARVLEGDQPLLRRITWRDRRYLAAFTRLSQGSSSGHGRDHGSECGQLVLLLCLPLRGWHDPRAFALGLFGFLALLGTGALFLPFRLSRHLMRLQRRVEALARRAHRLDEGTLQVEERLPGLDETLLLRGDELGDLSRAVGEMTDAVREHEARLGARVRELTTLHAIGRAISSVLDLEEVLRKIVGEVVAIFAARRGALVLVGGDMRYNLGAGIRIEPAAAEAVAALAEVLVRRGGRVRIDDLRRDPELAAAARHGGLSGSLMAAPLDQQGRILGILLITRSRGRQHFTEADLQLLSTVADQASTAISNARLYDEVQRSSEDLELRVKERTYDLVMANQELARAVENLHQAQAQLLLSERLAGLGQLVAGVAHEINSPAAAIRGAADALEDNVVRMGERARQLAELPLSPSKRARFLTLCDDIAAQLHTGVLPSPAQVRRRGRDFAAEIGNLALAPEDSMELLDCCRTLAELGIEDRLVLDELSESVQALGGDQNQGQGQGSVAPVQGLAIMVGYLEERAYLHRNAHAIRTAIGQITRIVGALKSYSHLDQVRIELTDIHEGLETTLVILHSELKYGIVLTRKYGKVPAIHAYVDELNQVWTNLLHNAVQALHERPEHEGAQEIVIETGYVAEPPGGGAGEVWVAIEDNGPGIPKEALPRIFEPFFTTKQKGEGTGIGLGIVRQIVGKHGGRIEVSSIPGRTRFTVWLPVEGPGLGQN